MTVPKVPENLDVRTPGSLVDLVWSLKEQRKLIETRAEMIREEERRIEEHLIQRLTKEEINALSGKHAKCSVSKTQVASAEDWDKVNKFIEERDAWQIRNKALNQLALRELHEAGVEVPGVTWFTQIKLNVRKV